MSPFKDCLEKEPLIWAGEGGLWAFRIERQDLK